MYIVYLQSYPTYCFAAERTCAEHTCAEHEHTHTFKMSAGRLSLFLVLDSIFPILLQGLRNMLYLFPRKEVQRLCVLLDTATCASVVLPWFVSTYFEMGPSAK